TRRGCTRWRGASWATTPTPRTSPATPCSGRRAGSTHSGARRPWPPGCTGSPPTPPSPCAASAPACAGGAQATPDSAPDPTRTGLLPGQRPGQVRRLPEGTGRPQPSGQEDESEPLPISSLAGKEGENWFRMIDDNRGGAGLSGAAAVRPGDQAG